MTLTDRSRALLVRFEELSKEPFLVRAQRAEALIHEAALVVFELSKRSEEHAAAIENLLHLVEIKCEKQSEV